MFGMLDYRAHKLFSLLTFPFRLVTKGVYFILIAIAVWIGVWTGYQPLLQRSSRMWPPRAWALFFPYYGAHHVASR
jgi:hypothetical protein